MKFVSEGNIMIEYAPGMRLIIRDEEWMIKKIDTNEIGEKALSCIGISTLVIDCSLRNLSIALFLPIRYK